MARVGGERRTLPGTCREGKKRLPWLEALSLLMLSALAPAWAPGEGVTVGTEDNFFGTKRRRHATPRMG